ncbi:MAG TPA: 50S ribosomal protein L24 [Thermoanaerobaculia bacterium]|nr:50S ribosomal protein L24 [Thermoanaerobaculia bacterium]
MRKVHVKKNDQVLVLAGRNQGTKSRVLRVLPAEGRAVVEHVNMIKRHTRANPGKGVQGGILEREGTIHLSNVMVVCPECGVASRVGRTRLEDGKSARVCKKCGAKF